MHLSYRGNQKISKKKFDVFLDPRQKGHTNFMELSICAQTIEKMETDAVIIAVMKNTYPSENFFQKDMDLVKHLELLIDEKEVSGELEEVTIIHTFGTITPKRIVLMGLGEKEKLTLDKMRKAVAVTGRKLRQINCQHVGLSLDSIPERFSKEDVVCAFAEAFLMGLYRFPKFSKERKENNIKAFTFSLVKTPVTNTMKQALNTGKILAGATNYARDIVNAPSNIMTPEHLANLALKMAEEFKNFETEIFDEIKLKDMGMDLVLAVSSGSAVPPRVIITKYKGNPESDDYDIALLGKGVSFDSGGISLKAGRGMHKMKADLTGGATVLATMQALASIGSKINIIGMVPSVENMPSSKAYKPGDVFRGYGGKTVEIINTDAEGRLILADSLSYLQKDLSINKIIDVATLTGSALSCFGHKIIGLFSSDDELYQLFEEGCWHSGEYCWRMPLFEDYKEMLQSDIADIKNLSYKHPMMIEGALFLQFFVEKETKWMHLDIANLDMAEFTSGYVTRGATGAVIRSLVRMLLHMKKEDIYEHTPYPAQQYGGLWKDYPEGKNTIFDVM